MGINDFIAATVRRALPDGNFWLNFFFFEKIYIFSPFDKIPVNQ